VATSSLARTRSHLAAGAGPRENARNRLLLRHAGLCRGLRAPAG
jgi:hypothetical protein